MPVFCQTSDTRSKQGDYQYPIPMTLYFSLKHETVVEATLLERRVTAVVNSAPLENEHDLATAVESALGAIDGSAGHVNAKRDLAKALGEGSIYPGINKDDIIKKYVRSDTFYSRRSRWLHDPSYREVLEIVIALYRRWENGRAMRELADRQRRLTEAMYAEAMEGMMDLAKARRSAMEMIERPLEEVSFEGENGQITVWKPAKWNQDTANRRLEAVSKSADVYSKLGRLALGMTTDSTEQRVLTADISDILAEAEDVHDSILRKFDDMHDKMMVTPVEPDSSDDGEDFEIDED